MKVLQEALAHIDGGEPQAAIALLTAPHDAAQPAWPVILGLACIDAGDLEQATEQLGEAVRLAPENRLARGLQAVLALRQGKPDAALRLLDRWGIEASSRLLGRLLVEVERTLTHLGVAEGSRLREGARLPDEPLEPTFLVGETIGECDGSASVPGPSEAHGGEAAQPESGAVRGASGSTGACAEAPPWDEPIAREGILDRVVGAIVDPLFAQVLVSRAERALAARRTGAALVAAREAVRRYPDIPRGFCILGLAWLGENDPRAALRCLAEAARRDGETPDVLYAQGCCHHEMGNLEEARRRLRKMLDGFAKDAAAYYTLGQIELEQSNEGDARACFERAAFLDFLIVRERIKQLSTALTNRLPQGDGTP